MQKHSRFSLALALLSLGLLAACQSAPKPLPTPTLLPPTVRAAPQPAPADLQLSGRISVQTGALPGQAAQFFLTQFSLQGRLEQGQLDLQTPTGNLLAVLRWQPGGAQLEQAGKPSVHYPDLRALLRAVMGDNSPEPALLFAWLQGQTGEPGQPEHLGQPPDWQVDSRQFASKGLLTAVRLQPLPRTQVRIKLDNTSAQP